MLFYFPAELKLCDLPAALSQWLNLLDKSPLDAVSLLKISVLGWQGNDRFELPGKGGFAQYIIFDRCYDAANEPLCEWVPRLSSSLFETQDVDESQRAERWFNQTAKQQ